MWKINVKNLENLIDSMVWCSTAVQPIYNKVVLDNSIVDFDRMNNHVNLVASFIVDTTPYIKNQSTEHQKNTKDYITKIIWNKCVMEVWRF